MALALMEVEILKEEIILFSWLKERPIPIAIGTFWTLKINYFDKKLKRTAGLASKKINTDWSPTTPKYKQFPL